MFTQWKLNLQYPKTEAVICSQLYYTYNGKRRGSQRHGWHQNKVRRTVSELRFFYPWSICGVHQWELGVTEWTQRIKQGVGRYGRHIQWVRPSVLTTTIHVMEYAYNGIVDVTSYFRFRMNCSWPLTPSLSLFLSLLFLGVVIFCGLWSSNSVKVG